MNDLGKTLKSCKNYSDRPEVTKELTFKAIRSGGSGGQHVNKVSSKVVLFFDISKSENLTDEEKELLTKNLHSRLTKGNILILSCGESRSQHKNKEIVIDRFNHLIFSGLKIPKERRKTKPSKSSIQKRLETKKKLGLKKAYRKRPDLD
jgi:ribosome-associated protein